MKISIVGITGYSGLELVKILNNHKKVELVSIHATKEVGRRLSDVYPYLTGTSVSHNGMAPYRASEMRPAIL